MRSNRNIKIISIAFVKIKKKLNIEPYIKNVIICSACLYLKDSIV